MTFLRQLGRGAATALTGVAVLAAVCAGVGMWAGYRPQPVLTGSMEPALAVGSVTIAKRVPASSVRVGDVITFDRPASSGTITHRVQRIIERNGTRLYKTKGDANDVADPWTLRLPGQVGRNVADIPLAGYAVLRAGRPKVRAAVIALLTLLLMAAVLRAIWGGDRRRTATA